MTKNEKFSNTYKIVCMKCERTIGWAVKDVKTMCPVCLLDIYVNEVKK